MKNLILISALVLTTISSLFSQSPDDYIDPENINEGLIESMMFNLINKLRENRGLPLIKFDSVSYSSADYQNKYYMIHKKYSHIHFEKNDEGLLLETPNDRIEYFSEKYGENGRKYGRENCTGWDEVSVNNLKGITYYDYVMDAVNSLYGNEIHKREIMKEYKNSTHYGAIKFSIQKEINGEYTLISTFVSTYKFNYILN